MWKKMFLGLLFMFASFDFTFSAENSTKKPSSLYLSSTFNDDTQSARLYFAKNKPVIVWDIHNVLMQGYYAQDALRHFFDGAPTISRKALIIPTMIYIALLDWRIHPQLYNLYKQPEGKHKITESYFNILKQYGYADVFNTLVGIGNNIYREMPGIRQVIDGLTISGCPQELLSNIGPQLLADLKSRNVEFFSRFGYPNLINSIEKDGHYEHQKPLQSAYEEAFRILQTRYPDIQPHDIIFIDDKKKNVMAPLPLGWNTLHFSSVKDLQQKLSELGLMHEIPKSHL